MHSNGLSLANFLTKITLPRFVYLIIIVLFFRPEIFANQKLVKHNTTFNRPVFPMNVNKTVSQSFLHCEFLQ